MDLRCPMRTSRGQHTPTGRGWGVLGFSGGQGPVGVALALQCHNNTNDMVLILFNYNTYTNHFVARKKTRVSSGEKAKED